LTSLSVVVGDPEHTKMPTTSTQRKAFAVFGKIRESRNSRSGSGRIGSKYTEK